MSEEKRSFRHESLVYPKRVRNLLSKISEGFGKGKITFEDENETIEMEPEGLLSLKVTASQEDNYHRMTIRVSWEAAGPEARKRRKLTISSG